MSSDKRIELCDFIGDACPAEGDAKLLIMAMKTIMGSLAGDRDVYAFIHRDKVEVIIADSEDSACRVKVLGNLNGGYTAVAEINLEGLEVKLEGCGDTASMAMTDMGDKLRTLRNRRFW